MNDGTISGNTVSYKLPRDFIEYPASKALEIRKISLEHPDFEFLAIPLEMTDSSKSVKKRFDMRYYIKPNMTTQELNEGLMEKMTEASREFVDCYYDSNENKLNVLRKGTSPIITLPSYSSIEKNALNYKYDMSLGDVLDFITALLETTETDTTSRKPELVWEDDHGRTFTQKVIPSKAKFLDLWEKKYISRMHVYYSFTIADFTDENDKDKKTYKYFDELFITIANIRFILERKGKPTYKFVGYQIRINPLLEPLVTLSNIAHDNKQFICNVNEQLVPPKFYDITGYKDALVFEFYKRFSFKRVEESTDGQKKEYYVKEPYEIPKDSNIMVELILESGTQSQHK
ncbi:hypothetical protein TVAG_055140 [Trichomonas vaginalis G3]|nr:hypothetical protein TVAGG3_0007850 [Trichomonas vaginalis G3]EAY04028.1 hypothetical protein TVAG_055140 [Trichomonas vaginalis G3]KAI5539008.1 hypothetical protein TVAGG3_0007850 [Trichomonas vaginalis G3]|eukprot:XP_001316251.1 hypothetical protein [Trichomonas vaginalis G3]